MTQFTAALIIAFVVLIVALLALRLAWRAFIRATDAEIEKSLADLRRRGFLSDKNRRGGK
jgi:hypothetical protein